MTVFFLAPALNAELCIGIADCEQASLPAG